MSKTLLEETLKNWSVWVDFLATLCFLKAWIERFCMKLFIYSSADVSPCSDTMLTKHVFYVSSSMLEHSFLNWKHCKPGTARVYASIFAVKNYRSLERRRNELVALLRTYKPGVSQWLLRPGWGVCSEWCWAYGWEQLCGWLGVMHMRFPAAPVSVRRSMLPARMGWTAMLGSFCSDLFLLSLPDRTYKHVQARLISVLDLSLPFSCCFVFDTNF